MRTNNSSPKRSHWFKASGAFLACLSFLIFPSCQKVELNQDPMPDMESMSSSKLFKKDKLHGTVKDIDHNVYKTVKIGDQWWMAENLSSTRYNNGDLIGTTTPPTLPIKIEISPKYQWAYDGNEKNVKTYGRLYTWHAVTDSRGVCPTGWHVPTETEWTVLTDYLTNNGYGYGGSGNDIAKSMASTAGWLTDPTPGNVGNDQASNNSSGFTALPGGIRYYGDDFIRMGDGAWWWSSTERSDYPTMAYWREMRSMFNILQGFGYYKYLAVSVRCLKDN